MRVFFIGFGQAGGKVVDMFMEQDKTNLFRAVAVNTARTDLLGLKQIPMKDRVLIGQTVVKGHGVGTENALGAKITRDEIDPIVTAIESIGTHDIDAFVIVAGLGGGTGSGGTPVLAQALKNLYREPVYTIGIIPRPTRAGSTRTTRRGRSRRSSTSPTTRSSSTTQPGARRASRSRPRTTGSTTRSSAGSGSSSEPARSDRAASVRWSSTRPRSSTPSAAAGSRPSGLPRPRRSAPGSSRSRARSAASSAASARRSLPGSSCLGDDRSAKILSLVRSAVLGRLTLPCNYHSANRALILLVGPPEEMDRKGVEKARAWIEEQLDAEEIRSGDYPIKSNYVAAVVVLASIGDAPRIRDLLEMAKETKEELAKQRTDGRTMFDDGVDPLFEKEIEEKP